MRDNTKKWKKRHNNNLKDKLREKEWGNLRDSKRHLYFTMQAVKGRCEKTFTIIRKKRYDVKTDRQ